MAVVPLGGGSLFAHGGFAAVPQTMYVPKDAPTIQAALSSLPDNGVLIVSAGTYHENVALTNRNRVTIQGEPGTKIDGGGAGSAITVTGGTFISVTGVDLFSDRDALHVSGTTDVVINGVTVSSVGGDGVHAENVARIDVRDVRVTWAFGDGVRGEGLIGSVTVRDSTIEHVGGAGIRLDAKSDSLSPFDAQISGNTVRLTGDDGISARTTSTWGNFAIESNHVDRAGGRGIRMHSGHVRLSGNSVSETRSHAILVSGDLDDPSVTGNEISEAGGTGIAFESSNSRASVSGNTIRGARGDGISVSLLAAVQDNTISDVGLAGVRCATPYNPAGAYAGDIPTDVGANSIERTQGPGIVILDGRSVRVQGNAVRDAGATAVEAAGLLVVVTSNTIERPALDGVSVVNLGKERGATVSDNSVTEAGRDGIDIGSSSGVSVSANEVAGAGVCGFRVGDGATGNRFKGNVAEACAELGLMESDAAGANRFAKSNKFGTMHRRAKQHRK